MEIRRVPGTKNLLAREDGIFFRVGADGIARAAAPYRRGLSLVVKADGRASKACTLMARTFFGLRPGVRCILRFQDGNHDNLALSNLSLGPSSDIQDELPCGSVPIPCHPGLHWVPPCEIYEEYLGGFRALTQYMSDYGYVCVTPARPVPRVPKRLHNLICHAAHGAPPAPGLHARHLDDVKTHNHPGNLAWGTPQDNSDDCERNGNRARGPEHPAKYNSPRGSANHLAKMTEEKVLEARRLFAAGTNYKEIASIFKLSYAGARNLCRRKTWKHLPQEEGVEVRRVVAAYPDRRGTAHPKSVLTDDAVREMRRLRFSDGLSIPEISRKFGISRAGTEAAITGKTWGHLPFDQYQKRAARADPPAGASEKVKIPKPKDNKPEVLWATKKEKSPPRPRAPRIPAPPRSRPKKGRRVGSAHHLSKLTEEAVREMRRSKSEGLTTLELSRAYGVTWVTADKAIRGVTWKYVS